MRRFEQTCDCGNQITYEVDDEAKLPRRHKCFLCGNHVNMKKDTENTEENTEENITAESSEIEKKPVTQVKRKTITSSKDNARARRRKKLN